MANQNLSEFGEKLFVADADHTFIWDSAASISKRVSRNSWLNSGTLTSDAPVTISQTWNGTGSTVFTALKVNAASTASDPTSKLLDLQVGGTSQFTVRKDGAIVLPFGYAGIIDGSVNGGGTNYTWGGPRFGPTAFIAWTATSPAGTADTILLRDGAPNTLALRNGSAAQTFRVYNTFPGTGNNEYAEIAWVGNFLLIRPAASGTATVRGSVFGSSSSETYLDGSVTNFRSAGNNIRWTINSSGHFVAGTDNSFDIGTTGAVGRPKNIYVSNEIRAGLSVLTDSIFGNRGASVFYGGSDGNMRLTNNAGTDFSKFQLGGTTDSFPAIARDGAGIKFTGAASGLTSWIKVPPVAVSALPLAATAGAGARAFVNDASSPTFGSAVTGGGSIPVPVYSTGSAWHVG